MTFYDRNDELGALETAFESPGHVLYVVFGRRRVGKTGVLKQFCTGQPHIYFLAAQEAEASQREKFVTKIADHFGERTPQIDGWEEAFDYLGEKCAEERIRRRSRRRGRCGLDAVQSRGYRPATVPSTRRRVSSFTILPHSPTVCSRRVS